MANETSAAAITAQDLHKHDGKWYVKRARKADKGGDMLLVTRSDSAMCGKVQNVCFRLNTGVITMAGYGLSDGEYVVLEPLPDDFHVHGGAVYRKVKRRKTCEDIGKLALNVNGRLRRIRNVDAFCVYIDNLDGESCGYTSNNETDLILLEPLESAPQSTPSAQLTADISIDGVSMTVPLPSGLATFPIDDVIERIARGSLAMAQQTLNEERDHYDLVAKKMWDAFEAGDYEQACEFGERSVAIAKRMLAYKAEVDRHAADVERIEKSKEAKGAA